MLMCDYTFSTWLYYVIHSYAILGQSFDSLKISITSMKHVSIESNSNVVLKLLTERKINTCQNASVKTYSMSESSNFSIIWGR